MDVIMVGPWMLSAHTALDHHGWAIDACSLLKNGLDHGGVSWLGSDFTLLRPA